MGHYFVQLYDEVGHSYEQLNEQVGHSYVPLHDEVVHSYSNHLIGVNDTVSPLHSAELIPFNF